MKRRHDDRTRAYWNNWSGRAGFIYDSGAPAPPSVPRPSTNQLSTTSAATPFLDRGDTPWHLDARLFTSRSRSTGTDKGPKSQDPRCNFFPIKLNYRILYNTYAGTTVLGTTSLLRQTVCKHDEWCYNCCDWRRYFRDDINKTRACLVDTWFVHSGFRIPSHQCFCMFCVSIINH